MPYCLGDIFPEGGLWFRRILNAPTGLSTATLSINFLNASNDWYWTDGAELINAGLWEKLTGDAGVLIYTKLSAVLLIHSDEVGEPSAPPTSLPGVLY